MALEDEIQVGEPIVERGTGEGGVAVDQTDFQRQDPPATFDEAEPPAEGDVSIEALQAYLRANPDKAAALGVPPTDFVPTEEGMTPQTPSQADAPLGPHATLVGEVGVQEMQYAPDGTPIVTQHHESVHDMTEPELIAWCVDQIETINAQLSALKRFIHRATGSDPQGV